jgi:hypothetical protein
MNWSISIPYCDRSEPLTVTAGFVPHLPMDDDRAVARQIVFEALEHGVRTAGELFDHLEEIGSEGRKRLLSEARVTAGLSSVEDVEWKQEREAYERELRASSTRLQACHAEGCNTFPVNHLGLPREVDVARWFCPQHAHLAAPGDMQPRPSVQYTAAGVPVPVADEVELAREQRAIERREREREAEMAERRALVEEREAFERARAEHTRSLLPPGVPG